MDEKLKKESNDLQQSSEKYQPILDVCNAVFTEFETYIHRNQLSVIVPPDILLELAKELKNNESTSFDMLLDVTAIDWLRPKNRFQTVYFLYSNKYKNRLRIKVPLEGDEPECPTITGVWESADWYEREAYDMYGIKFTGHPNLRRFYMPEDYVDPETGEPIYPLRKDFPLMGIPRSLPLPPYPEKYGELE